MYEGHAESRCNDLIAACYEKFVQVEAQLCCCFVQSIGILVIFDVNIKLSKLRGKVDEDIFAASTVKSNILRSKMTWFCKNCCFCLPTAASKTRVNRRKHP